MPYVYGRKSTRSSVPTSVRDFFLVWRCRGKAIRRLGFRPSQTSVEKQDETERKKQIKNKRRRRQQHSFQPLTLHSSLSQARFFFGPPSSARGLMITGRAVEHRSRVTYTWSLSTYHSRLPPVSLMSPPAPAWSVKI